LTGEKDPLNKERSFPPMGDFSGRVRSVRKISEEIFCLEIDCEEISENAQPGQFVMLRFPEISDPLLGRPLAVAGISGSAFDVIFRIVGRMTKMLSECTPGQSLVVRGPEGRPFGEPSAKKTFLVAGTLGAAPLIYACKSFSKQQEFEFVLGVPDRTWASYCEWLTEVSGVAIEVFSEDGFLGQNGNVLQGLPERLEKDEEIWACGPEKMLSAICGKYPKDSDRILVSLEKRMACGYGGCMGCVIDTVYGKKRVCVDGPIFRGSEVCWNGL